jgi:hypothetical protein
MLVPYLGLFIPNNNDNIHLDLSSFWYGGSPPDPTINVYHHFDTFESYC